MNFSSLFSAIAIAALVLPNFGRQIPVKGEALQILGCGSVAHELVPHDLDSMARVQVPPTNAPDTTTNSPVISRQSVIRGIGQNKHNVNYIQSQGANFSADFGGLAAGVAGVVAVGGKGEREIAIPSSSCRFTSDAGLGLTVRIPYTQNHRVLVPCSSRSRHNGTSNVACNKNMRTKLWCIQPIAKEPLRAFVHWMGVTLGDPESNPMLKEAIAQELQRLVNATTRSKQAAFIQRVAELVRIFLVSKSFLEIWGAQPDLPDNIREEIRQGLEEDDSVIFANQIVASAQLSSCFGWPPIWTGGPRSQYPILKECIDVPADKVESTAHLVTILQAYKKVAGNHWHHMTVSDLNGLAGGDSLMDLPPIN